MLAPTGTIGFMMDCDTTGIEPDFSLVKFKKLVGGGSMQIVNLTIPRALRKMGYTEETIEAIVEFIADKGHVIDAPGLKPEHYEVFDTAMGARSISADGPRPDDGGGPAVPVRCDLQDGQPARGRDGRGDRGRLRPGLEDRPEGAGGLPRQLQGRPAAVRRWLDRQGRRATRLDRCCRGQGREGRHTARTRKRLPKRRSSQTTSFAVGGAEGYLTAGTYADGGLGEVFLKFGKQGSTLAGVMDAFSIAVSIGLQYGVPLETFVEKFTNMRFEPAGLTDDPDVRMAQSIMDYVFRRLALDYLDFETRSFMGIHTAEERTRQLETGSYAVDGRRRVGRGPRGGDRDLQPSRARLAKKAAEAEAQRSTAGRSTPSTVKSGAGAASAREVSVERALVGRAAGEVPGKSADAPMCMTCGTKMRPAGSCYVCEGCGSTSGCS